MLILRFMKACSTPSAQLRAKQSICKEALSSQHSAVSSQQSALSSQHSALKTSFAPKMKPLKHRGTEETEYCEQNPTDQFSSVSSFPLCFKDVAGLNAECSSTINQWNPASSTCSISAVWIIPRPLTYSRRSSI